MTTTTFLKDAIYQYEAERPYEISFTGATDIHLPFQGTVIAPASTTTPQFGGMYRLMFLSLRYPTKIVGQTRTFPGLRDYENKPLAVNGPFLILAADDTTILDDVHLGNLVDDITETYDPIFKDNTVLSSTPRYLLIQLNGVALPGDVDPISRAKGFQLRANSDGDSDAAALREALGTAALSGKILAFDSAGHQTEAYAGLVALGLGAAVTNPPPTGKIRIQFVDVHGSPLNRNSFPMNKLVFVPDLQGSFDTNKYYEFAPTDTTGKKAELTLKLKTAGETTPDKEKYQFHFHHAAVWPGYNSAFKPLTETGLKLDFFKDIEEDSPKPTFVRVALFHPADEFQTTAGGELEVKTITHFGTGEEEEQARFKDNGFRLFTTRNSLKVFNTGEGYFSDYYDEVSKLKDGDRLYQANWSGNAHLHMKGSMKTRLIQPSNAEPAEVQTTLKFIRENAILVPLDPISPALEPPGLPTKQDYLLIANHEQHGAQIKNSFAIEVETLSGPGDPQAGRVHRGFVRPNAIFAWKLKGDPDLVNDDNESAPEEHTAIAFWKNSMGRVQETQLSGLVGQSPELPIHKPFCPFPEDIIALDINDADPPQAVIRRTKSAADVRTAVCNPAINPLLLVLNLSAGSSHKIPLIPIGSDDSSTNLVLGTLAEDAANGIPGMTGDDVLAIAVILDEPAANQDLTNTLLTSFKTFVYSHVAHYNAAVPRLPTESGGLLRQAIAKGVEVRGLMWEQLLKRLSGGDDLHKGHANNHQLVNLLNRTVNGKRGYAFIDQATRELGAWHQKPAVFMRCVPGELGGDESTEGVAYLGGMDMALGRWETEYYYTRDPDRQSTGQNDVQMKITGDAAWDVLQNFRHRWKGMHHFLNDPDVICNPVNSSAELEADVAQDFFIPDPEHCRIKYPKTSPAFIQVNRTIPPFTCFSTEPIDAIDGIIVDREKGELGSMASYKKGIERARKFIFITEQYFYSSEIAVAVRDALLRNDGPEFAIIVLPLVLDESAYVDPLYFKLRQKILNILRYGYTTINNAPDRCVEYFAYGPGQDVDLSSRIAILSLVNRDGKDIYTHSKHIVVDDVWMTAGSANMTNRGLTYEMEINAAAVGQKLYGGGTNIVRDQRIELCRRLLGLPKAYTAVLEDPYAAFRLFKAIEEEQDSYSLNVYPSKPLVKWLDPTFVKRVPEDDAFNHVVDIVANMDVNTLAFNYYVCNLLDADGRRHDPDRLGYLAHMIGKGKLLSQAVAKLGFVFDDSCFIMLKNLLENNNSITLKVSTMIYVDEKDENDQTVTVAHGPYVQHSYPLIYFEPENEIQLEDLPTNQLSVTISPDYKVVVTANIYKGTTKQLLARGELTFNPEPNTPTVNYGEEYYENFYIDEPQTP